MVWSFLDKVPVDNRRANRKGIQLPPISGGYWASLCGMNNICEPLHYRNKEKAKDAQTGVRSHVTGGRSICQNCLVFYLNHFVHVTCVFMHRLTMVICFTKHLFWWFWQVVSLRINAPMVSGLYPLDAWRNEESHLNIPSWEQSIYPQWAIFWARLARW